MKKTYKVVSAKMYYNGIVKRGETVELTDEQAEQLNKVDTTVTLEAKVFEKETPKGDK